MTDLMTPPPEEEKTYTSDQQGLREAATEIGSNEPEISERWRDPGPGPGYYRGGVWIPF